ncbi:MAG TPA: hypothetical protein VGJ77_04795 [Gaiellaceae bacterium]|jgi:hypothetical protein
MAAVGTVSATSSALCSTVSATSKLLGGGITMTNGGGSRGAVFESVPLPNAGPSGTPGTDGTPTGWQGRATNFVSGAGAITIQAYAICSLP